MKKAASINPRPINDLNGGADGARTRDLRSDSPAQRIVDSTFL